MLAASVFNQNNGDVTKEYYAKLSTMGFKGMLAVALFRAQKRSTAAKNYRGGRYRRAAYDVKNWSLGEVCRVLAAWPNRPEWGWKKDPNTPGFEWVLYVELPTGQCSFHAAGRLDGPDFKGIWKPGAGSESNILEFCDSAWDASYQPKPEIDRTELDKPEPFRRSKQAIADGINEAVDSLF